MKFRELLKRKGIIRSFGAHDVFSALIGEQAGFETIFLGGFGSAASRLGLPDLNLLTLTEMADVVRKVASRVSVPIIADGDTGHGGVHNVARTVREFETAGAAGVILEDQVAPKRCGHFSGKEVIPADDMVVKLRAAVGTRKNESFTIVARTDARDVNGIEDAIERIKLYERTGADVVFIESPASVDELKRIPTSVEVPVLINLLTGGKTPSVSINEAEEMGFKIAVYPIESMLTSAVSLRKLSESILKNGSIEGIRSEMVTFEEVKKILGLDALLESVKLT